MLWKRHYFRLRLRLASDIEELADSNFSTIVESTNGTPFNVESAIYWNTNRVIWEGGGNTVGTRLQ